MKQLQLRRAYGLRTAGTILRTAISAIFLASMLLVLGAGGAVVSSSGAAAKTPGKTYCFKGTCHRVKTITETRRDIGKVRVVYASHYDHCSRDRFNPCGLTSSGERFRPNAADNAASPIYPDGTRLLVWNPRNGRTVVVRINNAGPYKGRRKLDLSRGAAEKLGFRRRGVARLHVKVLSAPTRSEARYRRHRRYAPVPGFVGAFRSIDAALLNVSSAISGLFDGPVHVAAGRETARQRSIRLAREERLRRAVARSMRKSRGRRHARLKPPLPISKLALVRLPMLQLADVEMGRSQHASSRIAALPTRRPYRPVRIASAANSRRIAKRVAARKRKKASRVAVASRRRVAKASTKRTARSKLPKGSSRRNERRKAKLTRPAKPSLRRALKKRSQGKRTRLAQLQKTSS
ncbi:MAG: RlpA-like double-psi beta-barrel domain-containing protein, partial [Hyphomicrobiaceae bacterium]